MRKILFSLLLFVAPAYAEPAIDLLALQHEEFPAEETARQLPENSVLGSLDWTFGTRLRPIKLLLDTHRVKRWRVHFFNGPGLRGGVLGKYEPHAGHTIASFNRAWERGDEKLEKHLRERVRLYCQLFANYPAVALEFSPTLEHNLSGRAFRRQARIVRATCPSAIVVTNPVKGVAAPKGYKVERHGVAPGVSAPCNVSLDGDDAVDIDVRTWLKENVHCESAYVWSHSLNCRPTGGDFIDPRKRKDCPTPEMLRTLFAYVRNNAPEVPVIGRCRELERPRLWKVFAENKGINDPRANKPLYLTPFSGDRVDVLTALGGREVGALGYFGPFNGGGLRYYSGHGAGSRDYAVELAERAERLTGSPYVILREGEEGCWGPLHPIYREGFFR